uniref:VWFD domain-containing protein n=1 Tax=Denticeps clupeoides TaxID=299321 RepID=A0AAY4ERV6_9TELE
NSKIYFTWGNYHFKAFDGDVFQLPSSCNYIFTSQCRSAYEDFNIQMRREVVNNLPTISKITMILEGTAVELVKGSIAVNGKTITLPFSQSGVHIEKRPSYIAIQAKLGLVAMWNEDDSFMVELDNKYKNQTCGLCGDFNGVQLYDEFIKNGVEISPADFGNFWKMDGPTETCTENPLPSDEKCHKLTSVCEHLLSSPSFSSCKDLVATDSFIKACVADMCHCEKTSDSFCLCSTITEFSRQCVHAGGKPTQWRTEQFCSKSCPNNMVHQECGSACADTCSHPDRGQVCEEHCTDGCFCPPGNWRQSLFKCICTTCAGGQWSCQEKNCPSTCSVEGGSHITTYDGKAYTFHGDCTYVLSKQCNGADFTVLGDLVKCGLTDTESCLKAVTLVINIQASGKTFVNRIYSQLPLSTGGVKIFQPSTFFIIVQASSGIELQIQLIPVMQVYITASPAHRQKICGLCGNYNSIQADDFTTMNGGREGTGAGFANTWKIRANCPDVKSSFEAPCSLSLENEKYAKQWCSLLSDPNGVFAPCHKEINPDIYKENCMYDSCNCEKSEDCMCAALSSYVHACASKGIQLDSWRNMACNKYTTTCPGNMVYASSITNSDRSCRCYSDPDFTCSTTFQPVDGCICAEGTYLDDGGKCVQPTSCSCYFKGQVIPPGEVIITGHILCYAVFHCMQITTCIAPMVFFNCSKADPGVKGSECQKSCNTLDMACISTECVSGCMCPNELVSDGKGGCIKESQCPCIHNGIPHQAGDSIKIDCNTCTCKDSKWECSTNLCHGTCAIYGEGHYITFDGKRYNFNGGCEYTLAQDYCGNADGTFRVITENIPCGTTGTTCSKSIKLFLGNNELILTDGSYQVVQRNTGTQVPYQIRTMGIYLVIEANNGLILMWDRKTSMFIKLSPEFKGHVCGLCGNYDRDANNDFTSRNQELVVDPLDFGNSWKVSPSCPNTQTNKNPCISNPYRQSWAQKQCSIIKSDVFTSCHSQVDPSPFFDACVRDSCACDSGGDCECFCTAVAAYAEACNEAAVCVAWRTPDICPLFCDYYNPPGECEWHYKPCGASCMKTCRNPSGQCSAQIPPLEGCYPKCPANQPFFDEDTMKCVEKDKKMYPCPTTPVPTTLTVTTRPTTIFTFTTGICNFKSNFNINIVHFRGVCNHKITSVQTSFQTTACERSCKWTEWFDTTFPVPGSSGGDSEIYDKIRAEGYKFCEKPSNIQCRAQKYPDKDISSLGQVVQCDLAKGLTCKNKDQKSPFPLCYNYQIRVLCCDENLCTQTTTMPPTTKPEYCKICSVTTLPPVPTSPSSTTKTTTTASTTQTTTPRSTTQTTSSSTTITTSPTTTPTSTETTSKPSTSTSTTTTPTTTTMKPCTCEWSNWLNF